MLAQGRRWALRLGAWPARKACCTAEVDQVGEVGSGRIRACRTVDLGVRPLAARIPFSLAAPDRPTGCFRHRDILGRIRGVTIASEHYHGTAGQRSASRGAARQGKGSTVEDSNESSSGCVCINTARQKQARHHKAWQCQARRSIATRGKGVCSGKRLMGASRWKHQHGAARFGNAGRGPARRGAAKRGQGEAARFPGAFASTRHGSAWRGVALQREAREFAVGSDLWALPGGNTNTARQGSAARGMARRGAATRGKGVCSGKRLMGASRWKHQHGAARFGSAGRGAARRGNARQGSLQWEATYGRFPVETPTRHGKATRGVARYGQARQSEGLPGRRLATVALPVSPNRRGSGRNG